jgi:hypothetical protein
LTVDRNAATSKTSINITIPGIKPSTVILDGLFDVSGVSKQGSDQYTQFGINLVQVPLVGDGKSLLKGTTASDLIIPFGDLIGEIALSPGDDIYKFQSNDKVFYFVNASGYQSDGFLLNLGANTLAKNDLVIRSGQLYDGYSGIDTLDFSNLESGLGIQLNVESSSGNDQIEIGSRSLGGKVSSVLFNLKPGFGSDKFYSDGSIRGIIQISGDKSSSSIKIYPSSSNSGGFFVNADYLDLKNVNEWFLLDSGASYDFVGDLSRQTLILGSPRTKVTGGIGPDDFVISNPGVRAEIMDFSLDDKLIANWGFWTKYDAPTFSLMSESDFRAKISLQFNSSNYQTTVRLESLGGLSASYVVSGFFDKYDIVKTGVEVEVRLTDSSVIGQFKGDSLTSSAGKVGPWLVHDMAKAVALTPYHDLVSFDASKVKTASVLAGFKSGADLLQLTASTAPAGGAISANLESKSFLSGAGVKLPTGPEQYVIYDTSTGVVYFDQDGNGPSPTWPALIMEKGTALVASDIQISKPQVYTLAADRGVINEGETLSVLVGSSNVVAGTEVSYSITGVSPFDLSGVKLTGSVKLDGNGEA